MRGAKKAVGAVVDGTALGVKDGKEEKYLTDTNDEPFLTSLEDDEPLILSKPRSPPMTGFFSPEQDSDQAHTPKPKAHKPQGKMLAISPSDRKTCAITGSSKLRFRYMNGIVLLHLQIYKILDALQSGDYMGLSKGQKLQTCEAALASLKSAHWIKVIQKRYDFFIENET